MPSINIETQNKEIRGVLIKTTLVDFPETVACTFFLPGCNLKCPYCYNRELAEGFISEEDSVTADELYEYLKKRKNVLSGLVISGGEALLNQHLGELISNAKSIGYKVKLDTNGTFPEKLEQLVSDINTKPDFIAMDLKTSPQKYDERLLFRTEKDDCKKKTQNSVLPEKILRSIKIISEYPAENREFRTVLVPTLLQKEDIEEISRLLPEDANWMFSQFVNENCLNPEFNRIPPFSQEQAEEFVKTAQKRIPNAKLR